MPLTEPFVNIPALSNFLESIGSHHVDLIYAPQNMLKSGTLSLYHYTDLSGLVGIVEKHDLWVSHSRYSNDDEEMTHGLSVVRSVLKRATESGKHDREYLQTLSKLTEEPEGVYICCFCEKDNLLSQWRGYGANGTGVSLQFAPKEFADVAGPDNAHGLLRFWKILYQVNTQSDIVDGDHPLRTCHQHRSESRGSCAEGCRCDSLLHSDVQECRFSRGERVAAHIHAVAQHHDEGSAYEIRVFGGSGSGFRHAIPSMKRQLDALVKSTGSRFLGQQKM